MNFENCFPLWNDLNTAQKKLISDNLITRDVKKGTIIHNGNLDCTGLLLVCSEIQKQIGAGCLCGSDSILSEKAQSQSHSFAGLRQTPQSIQYIEKLC